MWFHSYVESKENKSTELINTKNRLAVVRGWGRRHNMGEGQKVQTPVIKQIKPGNIMYIMVSIVSKVVLYI